MTSNNDHPKSGVGYWIQAATIGRNPRNTARRLGGLLVLAGIAFLVLKFILLPIRITGPSMLPTYDDGSFNLINRLAYWKNEPHRGEVVAIRFSGNHVMYVKRIVGLPGESIQFRDGVFEVNGQPLNEPYLKSNSGHWDSPPRQLGPQEYYVVGDNRSMPYENHEKGAAARERIIGRIVFAGHD